MLLLGEQISAQEAERLGFVNRVVAAEEFDAAVREWAAKLAAKSPVLMRLGKDALFRQQDMALADALEFLHAQLTIAFSTEDIQEGVKAFFEKRDPVWTGPLRVTCLRARTSDRTDGAGAGAQALAERARRPRDRRAVAGPAARLVARTCRRRGRCSRRPRRRSRRRSTRASCRC